MSTSYNLCCLPDSVLALSGYDFDQFIKNILGDPEAELLKKMSIQTTSSFLSIEDPLDIFNHDIDDEELEKLKDKLCFKLKNKNFLIKPGVISGVRSLREALKQKSDQQLAQSKTKRRQKQQLSNVNSSVLPLSENNIRTTTQTTTTNHMSLAEHRAHVQKLINRWCLENKEHFNLEKFRLEENVDFTLHVELDENLNVKGNIKCKCNKLISLAINDSKLQVSNYYKHLQSVGCEHMKNMRQNARNSKPMQQLSPVPLAYVSPASSPTGPVHSNLPYTEEAASDDNLPMVTNETVCVNKRRRVSQSQQRRSAKRSRL